MALDPLNELLATTEFAWRRKPASPVPLTDIQWRADACGPGSILFFRRHEDDHSDAELYHRYLAASAFSVLVTNRRLDGFPTLTGKGIYVTRPGDWLRVIGRFCDLLYPLASTVGGFIGVTGTDGKTTTVKYLEAMLRAHGRRVLTVGTLGVSLNGVPVTRPGGFTSLPQIELRRLLHAHRGRYDLVALEVSSHGLDQGRVHGIPLRNAGWTSFSQDHLDYHRTEAAYFAAKARILELIEDGGQLFCTSPEVVARLERMGPLPVPIRYLDTVSLEPEAIAAKPFLAMAYNRENYTLAAALATTLLGPKERPSWRHLAAVEGRFACRTVGKRTLIIDFAHTPLALETILSNIRDAFPGARILTLFGCGGDRDYEKRPLMGAAAARYSDRVIVTSDNPRSEDPERITEDILVGIPDGVAREVVIERPQAVAHLFDRLAECPPDESWVALIAGKGHERFIERNGRKTHYSDQEEMEHNLERLGWS